MYIQQARPSGDSLAYYVALLWAEVGQHLLWFALKMVRNSHCACIPLIMMEWWIGLCISTVSNGSVSELNKLCVGGRKTAHLQDEAIWGPKTFEASPCETCSDGR